MEIKKLKVGSLYDALREMEVGETRLKPDGRSMYTVKKTCSELKSEGYGSPPPQRVACRP